MTMRTVDQCRARLHAAGWSVGETGTAVPLLVSGHNGENLINTAGKTQTEAWHRAVEQAEPVGHGIKAGTRGRNLVAPGLSDRDTTRKCSCLHPLPEGPQTKQRIAELSKIMYLFHADVVASAVDLLYRKKRGTQAGDDGKRQEKSAGKKPRGRARKEN